MAVPRAQEPVPPPLPPPTYIPEISAGHDPGWQWGNDPTRSDFGRPASTWYVTPCPHYDNLFPILALTSLRKQKRHSSSNSIDSSTGTRWPPSGAVSPGYTGLWAEHGVTDSNRSLGLRHGSLQFDDSISHRGSYDQSMFIHEDMMEDGQMGNLQIQDRSPSGSEDAKVKAGTKRRASSPPREGLREERFSVSNALGHSDLYHRRSMQQLPNRGSPLSRFHPSQSSVSSASSYGPRHGSLGSSLGIASVPSSATSYGSGRLSPNGLSPAMECGNTAYGSARVLAANHQRTLSENAPIDRRLSADSNAQSRRASASHMQGVYICECCPKKPKKFETEEELRLHESEKQATSKFTAFEAAFMVVCSVDRHRSSLPSFLRREQHRHLRADHLNRVHKFGECNQAKKFFRADHFRQHLKHSHAGTSGKWTNTLENACMKDEPPPEKRGSPVPVAMPMPMPGPQAPPALMGSTAALPGLLRSADLDAEKLLVPLFGAFQMIFDDDIRGLALGATGHRRPALISDPLHEEAENEIFLACRIVSTAKTFSSMWNLTFMGILRKFAANTITSLKGGADTADSIAVSGHFGAAELHCRTRIVLFCLHGYNFTDNAASIRYCMGYSLALQARTSNLANGNAAPPHFIVVSYGPIKRSQLLAARLVRARRFSSAPHACYTTSSQS
ncbi:hypothetical protein KC347_g87 [Hortaea werneckii]|nr:hypothetical protein KC347_g87 [Hortaea werneckii]